MAVLAFDADQEALGSAMADTIIDRLAESGDVEVVGPVSARVAAKPGSESAMDALHVELLLYGSLRVQDHEADIEARISRHPAGSEVWSGRWRVPELEVFRIQSELAHRLAGAAGVELPTHGDALIHREPTTDLAAYVLLAEGRDLLSGPSGPDVQNALECFESAIELDGLYAEAWASIAQAHRTGLDLGLRLAADALHDPVAAAAERALELDDSLPDAHVSVGYAEMRAWRLAEAEAHLRLAIEIAPGHAEAHRWLSRCLMYRGDLEESIAEGERAASLEPLSSTIVNESGWPYAVAGRPAEAIERSRSVVHRDPEFAMAYFHLGRYAQQSGRSAEAVTYFRAAAELSGRAPFLTAFLGMALVDLGDRQEAEDIAHDLERKARRGSPVAAYLGALQVRLGATDEGLTWLEAGLADRDPLLLLADTHWLPLEEVHDEPRFSRLLEALPTPGTAGRRP